MTAIPFLTGSASSQVTVAAADPSSLKLVTWNLRYDSKPDNITVQQTLNALPDPLRQPTYLGRNMMNEQPWSSRRIRVAEKVLAGDVVLAGFQEALVRQVRDLAELLGTDWAWIGVGRDDGVSAGEYSPIFYKTTELKLISWDSFWLSNTPLEPSKYPGAGSFRICTAAHFEMVSTSKRFTLLNTHLDDQSDAQRRLGASLLLTRARYEAFTTQGPVLVIGDFNSPAEDSDSGAYQIATGLLPPVAINATFAQKYAVPSTELPGFKLLDLRGQAPRSRISTTFATFTGFSGPQDTSDWTRIDFVFGSGNRGWSADAYRVETALSDDGVLASDHRPVFADTSL
ncbi:hypothetical protein BDN72DRAFT_762830 [Pluteus cervinus]|uniref:Uncharacterized protein n=1 Tax=Pluteus cervinus TaxID=181527 RepID=A0ACD3B4T4_9AGAR|nr:hypothetical protein BDN72DRAFT_762830 [Pluteus cervinus]